MFIKLCTKWRPSDYPSALLRPSNHSTSSLHSTQGDILRCSREGVWLSDESQFSSCYGRRFFTLWPNAIFGRKWKRKLINGRDEEAWMNVLTRAGQEKRLRFLRNPFVFILENGERAAHASLASEIMFWTRITGPQTFHNFSSIIVLLIEAIRDKEV